MIRRRLEKTEQYAERNSQIVILKRLTKFIGKLLQQSPGFSKVWGQSAMAITCSKLTLETLEQCVKYVQC